VNSQSFTSDLEVQENNNNKLLDIVYTWEQKSVKFAQSCIKYDVILKSIVL